MRADRVLVLAPIGRDAAVLCRLLADHGVAAEACRDGADLHARLREGCGAVLLTEEALGEADALRLALADQPPWSDLPVLLLDGGGAAPSLPGATVLPRPARALAVLTAVEAALRARRRQYQVRDLLDRLRTAQEELELRVAERTAELEAEIGRRRDLTRRLATAQEDERRRVSRDLHDSIGQLMAGMSLAFKAVEAADDLPPPIAVRLAEAHRLASLLGREVHGLAVRLRPTSLDDLGLEAALEQLVADWSARSKVGADFHAHGLSQKRLPAEVETTVFRIVQEALTNVAKHARAGRASVAVSVQDGSAVAVVDDNGEGFIPAADARGRLGVLGMRERADLVGGELVIESRPGAGTTVQVRIPLGREGRRVARDKAPSEADSTASW